MDERPTIASRAKMVADSFGLLAAVGPTGEIPLKSESTDVDDQLARFSIWASNIGVFASGHASLDHRLRHIPEAKTLMIQLLEGLHRFVKRALYATGLPEPDSQLHSLDPWADETSSDTNQSSSQSSCVSANQSVAESADEADALTPSEARLDGIEQTVDRLYRLSVAIRRPSIVNQNVKAANFPIKDDEGNECGDAFYNYALQVVTHKCRHADQALRERLARTITLRRKRFLYRQKHQEKLSFKEVDDVGNITAQPLARDSCTPTISRRGSPKRPKENERGSLSIPKRPPLSYTSASLISRTGFDQSAALESASNVSTTVSPPSEFYGNVPVPPPPKIPAGTKEIECPYCFLVIGISETKTSSQWRKHVYRDLDPYVCLHPDCPEPPPLFYDTHTWAQHMQWEHNKQWRCSASGHTGMAFHSEEDFTEHLRSSHEGAFSRNQLPMLLKRAERPGVAFTECPLCDFLPSQVVMEHSSSSQRSVPGSRDPPTKMPAEILNEHVANHLLCLSMISLPWRDMEGEESPKSATVSHCADGDEASSYCEDVSPLQFGEQSAVQGSSELPPDPSSSISAIPEDAVRGPLGDEWSFLSTSEYFGHDSDPRLQTFLRKLYIESSPSMNDKEGPLLPCHFVPLDTNENFHGRQHALAAIEEGLLSTSMAASNPAVAAKGETRPRTFAICGPGGMGKSQVALEFVSRHREEFDAIFWVRADDTSKLAHDFNEIAIKLGLVPEGSADARDYTYTRELVKRWLVEPLKTVRNKDSGMASWLLVYDGVEVSQKINEFWPYDGPGCVLITSRNPFSWTTCWPLIPFTAFEATDFLLKLTERKGDASTRAAVAAVSQRLGGLPLALTQMAGVITYRRMTFDEFIRAYNERESRQELLEATPINLRGPRYEHNLASVWALENLRHGATLLNTLSMLDCDGIIERLLSENLGKVDLPGFPSTLEDYQRAKDELLQSSLITANQLQKKFFLHRTVQDVARSRLSKVQFRETFIAAVRMVSTLWPFESFTWRHGVKRWRACEDLFPHVVKLKDLGNRTVPSEDDLPSDYGFAKLLIDAGWYHHERGRSSEAPLFNDMAQTICEAWVHRLSQSNKHPASSPASRHAHYLGDLRGALAEITHNRGCIASETNEPRIALAHFTRFNGMMMAELDKDPRLVTRDMRLAISWNELGNAYMLNQQWVRGEECYHRSVDTMRKLSFFKEISLSLPIVNLGLSFWLQGKCDDAAKQLAAGLKEREETFGREDRESFITGRFLHALGNVQAELGRREESLMFHRKALLHYKSTLGINHHRTADLCVKVAEHSIRMEQQDTAMALLDHALQAYNSSKTYVPEKARALFKRSQVLNMMGKNKDAEGFLQEAVELYHEAAGEDERRKGKEAKILNNEDFVELIAFWSR